MSNKILLTAFEPFGLRRTLESRNASRDACDLVAADADGLAIDYQVLPVSDLGVEWMRQLLLDDPAGVVMTGESGRQPFPVAVERVAFDPEGQITCIGRPLPGRRAVSSDFAPRLAAALAAAMGRDAALCESIGAYYCNSVYWTGLQWADRTGRPAVFLHLSPRFESTRLATAVRLAVECMRMELELRRGEPSRP